MPEGFKATVFADGLGYARHLAVRDDGAVYTILRRPRGDKSGLVAMKDDDGDGVADRIVRFGRHNGTGLGFYKGYLYYGTPSAVYRYAFEGAELAPKGEPELVVGGLANTGNHPDTTLAFDDQGYLYVNIGSEDNACMQRSRMIGSKGKDPCPQLEYRAGIWRFEAETLGQDFEDGLHYAKGVRNAIGLDWNRQAGALFFTNHGRDQLQFLWPDYYTREQSAELPSEEFHKAVPGMDYGWPYTYYDHIKGGRMVAPEYGGDGETFAPEGKYIDPLLAFPGHWAPNDVLFYEGEMFPEFYHGGAFIAFHGSWNRTPFPQAGYRVVFVPFRNGMPRDKWINFATGFAGEGEIRSSGDAKYRPMGLAVGPDGALYISDSVEGRIWRVTTIGQ